MAKEDLVSLTVDKEIIAPIVEKHLKLAILEAFGGQDEIIGKIIKEILHKKVDEKGQVSSYSSDNKYSWIDITLRNTIEKAVRTELDTVMSQSTQKIKTALINILYLKVKKEQIKLQMHL